MHAMTRTGARRLVAAALLLLSGGCARSGDLRAPAIGAPAPAFQAMDLRGAPVTLAALRGRVVVLNVWATWCLPCREEIPQLEALHRQVAADSVTLIGVSVDAPGSGAEVQEFMTAQGMSYPVWLDPEHQFSLAFLTMGVPETFVIDRQGIIRHRVIGALSRGDTTLLAAVRAAQRSDDR
jgi:peroxiredoxin